MSCRRLAVLSVHSSPLAQPGSGDGGGMSVYVRALASALARAGVECDVLVRREHAGTPDDRGRGARASGWSSSTPARPRRSRSTTSSTSSSRWWTPRSAASTVTAPTTSSTPITGFRARSATGSSTRSTDRWPPRSTRSPGSRPTPASTTTRALRSRIEHEIVACADLMLASTAAEREQLALLYGADVGRIEIVPPGVDHELFRPVSRRGARPSIGPSSASRTVRRCCSPAASSRSRAPTSRWRRSPSSAIRMRASWWSAGPAVRTARPSWPVCTHASTSSACGDRVRFVPPQSHADLARYYQAVDVCLVPSHSESFGLVALEAAACGTPVVASAVGGLTSLVDDGVTGYLVDSRDPGDYAAPIAAAARRSRRRRGDGRARRGRVPPLRVEHDRGAAAPAVRGPARARAGLVSLTPDDAAMAAAHELVDAHLARAGARRGRDPARRVRPGAAPLVRALRLRRPATRRRSTSTCTSGRCATSCTSCPRPTTSPACPRCTPGCCVATTTSTAPGSRSAATVTCT